MHIHTNICTYATNTGVQIHVCTHINSKIHWRSYIQGQLAARTLNTCICVCRHTDILIQTHAHTDAYVCPRRHMSIRCTNTPSGMGHTTLKPSQAHESAQMHPCAGTHGATLAGACPRLPAHSSAAGRPHHPAEPPPPPIHLSVDRGQQAGPAPGSGGWACGGSGWRRHQLGRGSAA